MEKENFWYICEEFYKKYFPFKHAQLCGICWRMLSRTVFEFLVHKKQLFCGQTTLTSRALLDKAVGISFQKSKK